MISLKPVDFFNRSPAYDVPPSTQAFNKSVLHTATTEPKSETANTNRRLQGSLELEEQAKVNVKFSEGNGIGNGATVTNRTCC
jgi:hypothetical protein